MQEIRFPFIVPLKWLGGEGRGTEAQNRKKGCSVYPVPENETCAIHLTGALNVLGHLLCSPCLGAHSCFPNIFPIIRFYNHITHIDLQKPRKLEKISSHKIQVSFREPLEGLSATENILHCFMSYRIFPQVTSQSYWLLMYISKKRVKINVSKKAVFQNIIQNRD